MSNYKLYDLHTDLLTSKKSYKCKIAKLEEIRKCGNRSINAIFNENLSWKSASRIAGIFSLKKDFKIAFENCCYHDFKSEYFGKTFASDQKIIELANSLMSYKPLYLSLCWNDANQFASGCAKSGKITLAGLKFIDEINRLGGILDTAHINNEGFFQLIERAERVICSHTAFSFNFAHRRNISKEQIALILQKGGIVGLVAVGHFLTGAKGSISAYESAFYEHIDGYLQKFGDQGLAIATDFYGSDAPVFLNESYDFIDMIADKLLSKGVRESSVKNMLYDNAAIFFEKNCPKV